MRNIKRQCIPSKGCEKRQLTQGILPGQVSPDIQILHVSPETLKQLKAVEKDFGTLDESYLQRDSSALRTSLR